MYSLETINSMNRKVTNKAEHHGLRPFVAECDNDKKVFKCPNLGDYVPKGWEKIEDLFVDSSGWGSLGEPALTKEQFLAKVRKGFGYAITERGQFQVYIGVFKKK